eukprot:6052583-Pleurochrysis_carterae.AAC.1
MLETRHTQQRAERQAAKRAGHKPHAHQVRGKAQHCVIDLCLSMHALSHLTLRAACLQAEER